MRKSKLLLLLLTFFIWPALASAHDFQQNSGLFFNASSGLYRQKTDSRPWQLISLPEQSVVRQAVSFSGKVYLVVELGTRRWLYSQQDRPLQFSPLFGVDEADQIVIKIIGSRLAILSVSNTLPKTQALNSSGQLSTILPSIVSSSDQLTRLIDINGELYYLRQTGSTVSIYHYQNGWILVAEPPCQNSQILTVPIVGLFCLEGSIIYHQSNDNWLTLNLAPLRQVANSKKILAGYDLADESLFHIWANGQITTIQLPTLVASQTDRIVTLGNRVLLRKIAGNWYELLWQASPPVIAEIANSSSGDLIAPADDEPMFVNSVPPLFSAATNNWLTLTVAGQFNFARLTALGYLIWNNGSLTQFAPLGETVFTKVNPWSSTTSPIQAVEIGQTTSFVSVITQSGAGNVNLYKSTDFTHWSRLTLPTKPTLSPTIIQARALNAGSLVELSGVITVPPKIVDSEALYLEDATAGIQVYLSQSSGLLPTQTKINAVATGEISSSQTKRVLLDSPSDLELGSSASWTAPTVGPDEAETHLGRSVQLKGSIESIDTDYLNLRQLAGSLKLHFIGAKTIFQPDDQLVVPAVIDWNSSSGKSEAWALSADYQLLSRVQPTVVTATTSPVTATTTATPKKTVTAKKTTITNSPPSLTTTGKSSTAPKAADTPVIVAAAESHNDNRTISMSAVSLVAGLLSFRGRRLRRYLPD